ncbi:MAG TPA: CAP domain-containing protein, partial [Caulifigura sp.]|nr:CAP domain-containing protein [Caulifigura sp.]
VLVSTGFVDRFHLLTTREGTLVFTVPARILPSAGSVSSATEPMPVEVTVGSDVESLLLKLTNAEREKAQVPALSMSPLLLKAARQHSENMAKQHKLEHQLDGKNASDRLNDLSYTWRACGENIALGPRTPADAIRSWMESPGHRANLLSADFTQIGVALQADANGETYWTMVLAAPR